MAAHTKRGAAALVAVGLSLTGLVVAGPAHAATSAPPYEPVAGSVGTLTFYDASGNIVTSGKSNVAPFANYAVGSVEPVAGNTQAGLIYANPDPNATPANWYKQGDGLYTKYPVTASGTPSNIASATTPVNTGGTSDLSLDDFESSATISTTAGYQNVVQVRLRTANAAGAASSGFDVADLSIDPTTHTWTQIYPTPAAATAPGAPTGVSATPGNASATVSFTPPTSTGGAAISGYKVEYSSNNGTSYTTATSTATTSPYTVTGLTNGTAYIFRVTAINSAGAGTPSSPSASVTPQAAATAPTAPQTVSATAGNASATVTFTPPSSNGGSAITGYKVEYSSDNGATFSTFTSTATSSPVTVTGLTNGTPYIFRVSAINSVGSSPTVTTTAVTPKAPTAPVTAPTNVAATAGDTTATVSWTAPSDNGGSNVTAYKVEYAVSGTTNYVTATSTATASPYTVTGLTDGVSYVFRVTAINAIGAGPASANSNAVTPAPVTAPGVPTNVNAFGGNMQVRLVWNAPASNGGSVITGYKVEYSANNGESYTTFATTGTATNATVTGLTNGTSYLFRVSAINAIGTGSPSTPVTATPIMPISAPTSLDITATPATQYGTKITVGVTLTDTDTQTGVPATVTLYRRSDASQDFVRFTTVVTDANGNASLSLLPGAYTQWEWRYDGTMSYDPSTSPVAATTVQQLISVGRTATQVQAGKVIVIFGQVVPTILNEGLYLQQHVGTTWQNVKYALLKKQTLPNGKTVGYQIGVRFTEPGAARYRVYKPDSDGRVGVYSESFIVGAK